MKNSQKSRKAALAQALDPNGPGPAGGFEPLGDVVARLVARLEAESNYRAAVREWCSWIYSQAELAARTQPADAKTHTGEVPDWRDHCGVRERGLIEAAMAVGVWAPVES